MSPSATTLEASNRRHARRHFGDIGGYDETVTAPNDALRAARASMLMSQDDFARALRTAGADTANKRLVQRWEAGVTTSPRPVHARALEVVTRLPIESLGFSPAVPHARVRPDGRDGHDVDHSTEGVAPAAVYRTPQGRNTPAGNYSGVWLSRYEYFSSGRDDTFVGLHYVLVLQHGDRLTVKSLPGSAASTLTLDMTADGSVLTGTWVEQTEPDGYYRGARYHGAIQMLAEPTGRRLVGKWVGFGKEMDINTGPWEFVFQDGSTNKATLDRYNRPPA